jgi:hypothetical protein
MINKNVIIGVVLLLSVLLYYVYSKSNSGVNNFIHELPKKRYQDVVDEFGEPNVIQDEPNGFAIWNNKDYFTKIVLQDESIKHLKPKPHCDFLYATINVFIPDKNISKVLNLSQSVYYDNLKRELTARCHFMGANVATLYLAMMIINTPNKANSYHKSYGPTIMSTSNKRTYNLLYDNLKKLVKENQSKYSSKMAKKNCNIVA